jgi:general secretion pathway protein E
MNRIDDVVHARASAEPIAVEEIDAAREAALHDRRRVVDVLEETLGQDPDAFMTRLGLTLHLPVLRVEDLRAAVAAFDILPFHECSEHGCMLLRGLSDRGATEPGARGASRPDAGGADELWLATDDPFSEEQAAWAEDRIAPSFSWCLVHHGDLVALMASHEETLRALDTVQATAAAADEDSGSVEDLSLRAISEESSEVVRLVRSTLRDAIMIGASDIHLESVAQGLSIKFRIDGILSQVKFIQDPRQAEQAISRVKVLAELDITERRVPQDGRFKAQDRGHAVDFRVSIMPSIHGEDAVLRILDKQSLYEATHQQLSLGSLGFEAADIRALRRLSHEPYGMLLVTGPTGSGKTTTLYAAISEINNGQDKIVTIEDPVEYQLPGVLQIPVNEKKGLGFARGLRSILRHDPDKIMVGEIRDPETANIAVQSALTGHLVFTTVHANNVFDVIGRFMHMNVDVYSFVSALNAILAQRLVRLTCTHCSEEHRPSPELLEASGLSQEQARGFNFRAGRGCRECRGSGFRGRKAVAELLILNDELRELITARAPLRQLKEAARLNGTRFLREAAFDAVRTGQTTLEEINRVTFVS